MDSANFLLRLSRKAIFLAGIVLLSILFFVNSASADSVTVNCSGTDGSETAVTEAELNADDVTFSDTGGDGYCILDAAITAASVIIETGVTITHTAEDSDGINISTTGNFTLQSGAFINADAKGCGNSGTHDGYGPNGSNVCTGPGNTAGWGDGNNSNVGAGGGDHAGTGGTGSSLSSGGAAYGSPTAPVLFGSSGGNSTSATVAGSGGGYVRLNISGAFTDNGTISADGGTGATNGAARSAGGGSGGSIYITVTGALSGSTGTFSADGGAGGNGSSQDGGGGGGGRISLSYGSSTFDGMGSEDFTVTGGTADGSAVAGGVGTVYVKNTGGNSVTIYHGFTFDDTDYSVTNWTMDASADAMNCEAGTATPSITASGTLALDGTLSCDIATITSFNFSAGTAMTVGSGTVMSIAGRGADVDFNIPASDDQTWTNFTFTGGAEGLFTIDDAIDIELAGTTAINANAQWTALVDLTIGSSASINANAKGCQNLNNDDGFGPSGSNVCAEGTAGTGYGKGWNITNHGSEGAGHGGGGGAGSSHDQFGATYGSPTAPVLFGSSGGTSSSLAGGNGGGYIRLNITGAFTDDGAISVDGGAGSAGTGGGGGGSGGSIYITVAGALSGSTGTFSADGGNGGDGSSGDGGGGGGGRISLSYGSSTFDSGGDGLDSSNFTVTAGTATGSAEAGAIGTTYVKDTGASAVTIYHGFDFDDTDYSVTNWTVDPGADSMYCVTDAATPSVTATGTLAWDGTLSCDLATITSFNFSAGAAMTVGSGTIMSVAGRNADVDFNIPAGDDQTWTNFTFTGAAEGDFTIDDAIDIDLAGTTAINANAQWTALVDLTIGSSASINANAKGCQNLNNDDGFGPSGSNVCAEGTAGTGYGKGWNITNHGSEGAGHGGGGGAGSSHDQFGATYGSPTAPVLFGSSGGTSSSLAGGNGGGYIRLNITGAFTDDGAISADGGAGSAGTGGGGGGSGGSVYITVAGALSGDTGTFSADGGNGGDGSSGDGGGGGGGRISLNYGSSTFDSGGDGLDSSNFTVTAGTAAGSAEAGAVGTTYVKDTGASAVTIYHGFTFDDTDYSVTNWTVDSSADNMYCETDAATPSVTASGTLAIDGTLSCDLATITSFNWSAGTAMTVGSGTVMSIAARGADVDFNIAAGDDQTWTNFTFTGGAEGLFTIDDAIDITLAGTTAITANAHWTALVDLAIGASASINANAKGCVNVGVHDGYGPDGSNVCTGPGNTAGWGDGNNSNLGAEGGGHGGAGGAGSSLSNGGATYGSSTVPVLFGSSGGNSTASRVAGNGGGYLKLLISGTLTHNGAISADGGVGATNGGNSSAGGGSGGSIYVTAGSVIEDGGATGTFSADGGAGGNGSTHDGGGGGGGRVAIEYGSDVDSLVSNLTAAAVAAGGAADGSAVAGSDGSLSKSLVPFLTSITINDNNASGFTNDTTPQITLVATGSTATDVAFSCNGGTNWSAWLTYPDDDVVNDGDGPAWDMTTGATGCTTTQELKTITAKVKDGSATESATTNDTTTYDATVPTVSAVTATNANDTYGASVELTITVQFSDSMAITGTPQIELDFDGTDRQASYASVATDTLSFTYTTQNGDNVSDLAYTGTGALTLNSGTITDLAGNTATLTLATPGEANSLSANKAIVVSTNQDPTVASVTAVQGTDGTGDVTITFIMDDPDDDDTLQAKIEYSVNGGGAWADPTLSTTDSETTATYGDPDIANAQTYQVGQSGAYITSSSGANTVSIVWEAATDVANSTDITNAQIKVTPYDSIAAGTAGTSSNFVLDVVSPSGLTEISYGDFSLGNIVLSWSAVTETNFSHYELWHGSSQTDVQNRNGAASEWDNDNDSDLTTAATTSTSITVDPRNKYYKIFAIDDYGNAGTVTEVYLGGVSASASSSAITVGEVTNVSVTDYAGGGVELTWEDPDDDSTSVQILRGVNGLVNGTPIATVSIIGESYVDTDVEPGDTVIYQLRATNGSATGDLTDEVKFVVGSSSTTTTEVEEEEEEEEEEVEEEETEDETEVVEEEVSGTDDDEETDEVVEEEEEVEGEVVEEEEEEPTVEELGVEMPSGWDAGYFRWLGEDENIYEAALEDEDYLTFLTNMFENPDDGLSRGGAIWILATLTGVDMSGVYKQEFSDVSSTDGAYEAIQASFEEGLISGYEDGTFKPENLLNRAESMKLLTVFFEAPVNGGENPFSDVAEDAWYAPYVGLAYENGLISARGEALFNPSDTMTYTDFIKIVLLAKDAWGEEEVEDVVEEEDVEDEEEIDEDVTEDEDEVEEDVAEEVEEEITHTVEDLDMDALDDHWSKGYLENLVGEEDFLEEAITTESFFDLLTDMFVDPDKGMDRGQAMQFLVTLAGYDVPEITETSFTDLDVDHERAPYIEYAYSQALIGGYPDGTFRPDQVLNRVEALKIIMVFFEKDVDDTLAGDELLDLYELDENPFDDLGMDSWYAAYVFRAFADGVVQGYGDGTFGPADDISYGAFVKIATLIKDLEDAVELSSLLE